MLVICTHCGKSFDKKKSQIKKSKNHFCTRSCAASYNNKGHTRRKPIKRTCKTCGAFYFNSNGRRSRVHCHNCFETNEQKILRHQNMTLQEFHSLESVANKHPSWKNAHIRNFNRSWNKQLTENNCQNCEYSLHVELAHIKPISSFGPDGKLGEINHPQNILVLCRNCHWEFDNGYLSLEKIPKRA